MAQFPDKSTPSFSDPYGSIQYPQPPVMTDRQPKQIVNGQSLLNAKAVGKMNENRSTTLRPAGKQKRSADK